MWGWCRSSIRGWARITKYIPPQKTIPAALRLVDIAGIVKGASVGEGLGNKFLSHIREVDAVLQVVRCFTKAPGGEDIIHVSGSVDPIRDIEIIGTELIPGGPADGRWVFG